MVDTMTPPSHSPGMASDAQLTSSGSECGLVQLVSRFSAFVVSQIEDNSSQLPAKHVIAEADRILGGAEERGRGTGVLVRSLLGHASCSDPIATVKSHIALLQRFTVDDTEAQGSALTAVEEVISQRPELLCKTPRLFKALYDSEIVDETVFLEWEGDYRHQSAAIVGDEIAESVRTSVRCFLDWLRNAESESDDSDDSDDDDESDDDVEEIDMPSTNVSNFTDDEEDDICCFRPTLVWDPCDVNNTQDSISDDGVGSDDSLDEGSARNSLSPATNRNDSGICGSVPPAESLFFSFCTPRPGSRVSFSEKVTVHTVPDEPRWGSWAADGLRERMEEQRRRKGSCIPYSSVDDVTTIDVEE